MPPETWRYLDLDRQGPFENASVMPVLARSVMEGSGPVAQTSVWGTTHLNVGWFDDVDATLDLARCDELGDPLRPVQFRQAPRSQVAQRGSLG